MVMEVAPSRSWMVSDRDEWSRAVGGSIASMLVSGERYTVNALSTVHQKPSDWRRLREHVSFFGSEWLLELHRKCYKKNA